MEPIGSGPGATKPRRAAVGLSKLVAAEQDESL